MEAFILLAVMLVIALSSFLGTITHRITRNWSNSAGTLGSNDDVSADGEHNGDPVCPNSATTEFSIAFALAALKSIYILSTKDVTLKTNSSGSPDDTIAIKANVAFVWTNTSGVANPFSQPVTKFFFANASGASATVKVRALVDLTP